MVRPRRLAVVALAAAVPTAASADDEPAYTLHGFVLADYAARITGDSAPGVSDFLVGEERGRLEVAIETTELDAAARMIVDAAHDAVAGEARLELREAYLDYRAGPVDARLGRQVLTWGVGDLAFVNDVFPKDFGAFFAGRPIEFLKVPNDAARIAVTVDPVALDVVAIPFFTPDARPAPDRFLYGFDPFPPGAARRTELPPRILSSTELGARLHGSLAETDVALYLYRGFFHSPSARPDDPTAPTVVTFVFPPLSVYGASLQRNLLGGVVSAEAAYYHARGGAGAPPSSGRWLAGFERDLGTDLAIGIQYIGQLTPGAPAVDRYVQTATLRATLLARNQTLRLSLLGFLGITERDVLVVPAVEYHVSDRVTVSAGVNLFGGARSSTTFGIFEDDSNVYAWARMTF